jgi:HAD superfamily hydrolase (TIGR01549 family)
MPTCSRHSGTRTRRIQTRSRRFRVEILDASQYSVFDDARPALTRAAEDGWRSVVVSNHVPELEAILAGLELRSFFHAIITSGMVGDEKPHPQMFREALRHTVDGKPVWIIGDNVDADCRPACSLGMNAVLVRNTGIGVFEREAPDLLAALEIVRGYLGGFSNP